MHIRWTSCRGICVSMQACAECACMLGSAAVATAGAELATDQWQQLQHQVAKHLAVQLVS